MGKKLYFMCEICCRPRSWREPKDVGKGSRCSEVLWKSLGAEHYDRLMKRVCEQGRVSTF